MIQAVDNKQMFKIMKHVTAVERECRFKDELVHLTNQLQAITETRRLIVDMEAHDEMLAGMMSDNLDKALNTTALTIQHDGPDDIAFMVRVLDSVHRATKILHKVVTTN